MKRFIILLLAAMAFIGLKGQPVPETRVISLKECLKLAQDNSPRLQVNVLEQQKLNYAYKESVGIGLPSVGFTGSYDDYVSLPTQLIPGEFFGRPGELIPVQFGTTYNITGSLQASQIIYNQSFLVGLRMAKRAMERNTLENERVRTALVSDVAKGYYLAQIAKQQISNLRSNLEKLDSLYRISQQQYSFGLIKKVDVDRVDVNRLNLKTQIDNLEVQYQQIMSMQKYYMGLDQGQDIRFGDSLDVTSIPVNSVSNLDNHIDIRMIAKQKEIVQTGLQMDRAAYFPSLTLIGAMNYMNQSNTMYLFGKNTDWFNTTLLGLRLDVPIFNGFQKRNRVSQSKVSLKQIEVTEADTRRILGVTSLDAARKYQNSINTEIRQRKNMEIAEQVYAVSQEQYQEGIISLTDILSAESSLSDAQTAHTMSLVNMKIAELDYLQATGNLLQKYN
jgi:outer membrane protein TolC